MLLPLVYYGDPRLRKKCAPVEEVTDEIRRLIADMVETMDAHNGVGIAAPQVGRCIRLFVLRNYIADAEGQTALSAEAYAYINPTVSILSAHTAADTEGCLSIPGVREQVERPMSVRVEAQDASGVWFVEEAEGYNARVRLHENDHLNGVLFIDRIDPKRRRLIEPALRKLKTTLPEK
jgi:peptide deformylase